MSYFEDLKPVIDAELVVGKDSITVVSVGLSAEMFIRVGSLASNAKGFKWGYLNGFPTLQFPAVFQPIEVGSVLQKILESEMKTILIITLDAEAQKTYFDGLLLPNPHQTT